MLGDSAVAFMFQYTPPTRTNYLYYLDTLFSNEDDFFFDMTYLRWYKLQAFVVLDLEGNVLENHTMHLTYLDREGNDIMFEQSTAFGTWDVYENREIVYPSFDIDHDGNIYICRDANEIYENEGYELENGDLSAVKFWVDGRVAGVVDIPQGVRHWFPHLVKFSPHLDTIVGSRYLVQKGRSGIPYTENLVKCRQNGDVYVIWNIPDTKNYRDTIVFDSIQEMQFKLLKQHSRVGFLCSFDSLLNKKWDIGINIDSVMIPSGYIMTTWKDICFDEDSNLFFLCSKEYVNASYGDTTNYVAIFSYKGETLSIQKTSEVVMAFREREYGTPDLVGAGRFPSIYAAASGGGWSKGNMTYKNNRVLLQASYHGGCHFPSGTIEFENGIGVTSLGLAIYDHKLNVIGGFDYDSHSPQSSMGSVVLIDSILYLANYISDAHAQFGDISFQEDSQKHYAVIAKYIDTTFMTPYIAPLVTKIPETGENMATIYPNPANDRVQICLTEEILLSANAISNLGYCIQLNHNGLSVDVSPLMPGLYIMEIYTDKNIYKHKIIKY